LESPTYAAENSVFSDHAFPKFISRLFLNCTKSGEMVFCRWLYMHVTKSPVSDQKPRRTLGV